MAKEICISSTPHETRLAIIENDELAEIYYERENEYTLAGSIYKGRVTRVLPGMQSAFVDLGLERDAFLYVTDFLEEQEDSEDFERISAGPAPQQQPRREGGARREEAREPHPSQAAAPQGQEAPQAEEGEEESEQGGTRRWRGRRGRRRGLRGRQEEGEPVAAAPQETEEVHAADFGISIEAAEAAEVEHRVAREPQPKRIPRSEPAIVLPGESLSKYGHPLPAEPEIEIESLGMSVPEPSRPAPTYTPAKPSTLVENPIAEWDGGSLLPGESISRYRGDAAKAAQAPEPPAPQETAEAAVPAEEETSPLDFSREVRAVAAHVEQVAVEEAPAIAVDAAEVSETEVQEQTREGGMEVQAALEHEATAGEATVEEAPAAEEEPKDASAFHRVDPPTRSEFRLWGGFKSDRSATDRAAAAAPAAPAAAVSEEALAPAEAEAHELPAQHDSAEQSGVETVPSLQGFAPGRGPIEEETIEEEEYDFAPLYHGSEEHDSDELEEETLEHRINGGELGDVVRESHLNQRVNVAFGSNVTTEEDIEETVEEEELEEGEFAEEGAAEQPQQGAAPAPSRRRDEGRRGRGGRTGRRRAGGAGGGRRASAQTSDLPIISELLKQGQEILVQIAKEPIAKKGARITSHIALPGRFLVFMPTVNHVGVSRKISSDEERQRLKRILISEKGAASGGFIVRTAADGASEDDLRADIRFLINLWNEIKQRSDSAKAPALIYHDLNLVERILRDQVSDNFSSIWVDSEVEYERIVRFLNRFQPSLVRRVKLYTKETPLFEQFGIQDEITKALKSKVWLKSGGSIVINQTEALVAIDVNTGKYVGKTARLEDTILRTNLDAIPEIVRQIRLRDLGGIIIIDFIDMDERKNRHRVMQALEEALKADRAPSKVLQFNDFGLVAITRKRVKQSLERTLSVQCGICQGTGMVKSPATVCNEIYVEMRKMQKQFERGDVLLRVHPEVVKALKEHNARWLGELEEMIGKNIIVKSDAALHPEQFDIQ